MNRDLHVATSMGLSTISAPGSTKLSYVGTGVEGKRYLACISCVAGNTAGAFDVLAFESGDLVYDHYIVPAPAGTSHYSCPMWFPYNSGNPLPAGPNNITLNLDLWPDSGTVDIREAVIALFQLNEADIYDPTYLGASASTNSTSFVPIWSKSFEVPRAGDYLIMATAACAKDLTGSNFNARLTVDGIAINDALMRARSAIFGRGFPWCALAKTGAGLTLASLSAGSHTIAIEGKVATSGTMYAFYPSIVALRCDLLPAIHYAESRSESTTTATSYQTKLTLAKRMAANPMLYLLAAMGTRTSTADRQQMRAQRDGSTLHESQVQCIVGTSENAHGAVYGETPSIGDHELTVQWDWDVSGLGNAKITEAAIAAIEVENNVSCRILGGSYYGGKYL